jgi:hypothetical protein
MWTWLSVTAEQWRSIDQNRRSPYLNSEPAKPSPFNDHHLRNAAPVNLIYVVDELNALANGSLS